MPVGRPPKFDSPEQLEDMFEQWKASFADGTNSDIPDVEGLCVHLDTARQTLFDYEKKPEYSDTIKRLKDWIHYKKKQLAMNGKIPPAIYIFDAKNNAGYVDKQEVDQKTSGEVIIKTVSYKDTDSDDNDTPQIPTT